MTAAQNFENLVCFSEDLAYSTFILQNLNVKVKNQSNSVSNGEIVIVTITFLGKPSISKRNCNCTHSKGICDCKYYILNVITTSLF